MHIRRASLETPLTVRVVHSYGAPMWAQHVLNDAVLGSGAKESQRPWLDLVPTVHPDTFGGRYFPSRNAIAVYHTDAETTIATILHEASHWRSYIHTCGRPGGRSRCGYHGDHDRTFYDILAPIYRARGVPAEIVQKVEGDYPYPRSLLTQRRK